MTESKKVLVLNASYEPLNICNWKRAVILVFKGKAEQVEHNGKVIYANFHIPTVIRLRKYVKVPYKEIPLTRKNLIYRDCFSCQYCGVKTTALTIDHVIYPYWIELNKFRMKLTNVLFSDITALLSDLSAIVNEQYDYNGNTYEICNQFFNLLLFVYSDYCCTKC